MNSSNTNKYDSIAIGKKALEEETIENGQMVYQNAIFEWQDDAMALQQEHSTDSADSLDDLKESIASLWLSYANYNRSKKQLKTCVEAYEGAVSDALVNHMARIWLDYARFQEERKKFVSAQKIYIRALVSEGGAVKDADERQMVWDEFLRMMRQRKNNPNLTLDELQQAAMGESGNQQEPPPSQPDTTTSTTIEPVPDPVSSEPPVIAPPQVVSSSGNILPPTSSRGDTTAGSGATVAIATTPTQPPPPKRSRWATAEPTPVTSTTILPGIENVSAMMATTTTTTPAPPPPALTPVALAQRVTSEAKMLQQTLQMIPPDVQAAWMANDGNGRPIRPPNLFDPSPPKLSDASGSDILGPELALELVNLLLRNSPDGKKGLGGKALLKVSKACWMMVALKEKECAKALESLETKLKERLDKLDENLNARQTAAGGTEAMEAVKHVNQGERNEFLQSCMLHRQQLLDFYVWEFRQIIYIQQQLFSKINIPYFDGPAIDDATLDVQKRICSVLHSAFVLGDKAGELGHRALLTKLRERLTIEMQEQNEDMMTPMEVVPTIQQQQVAPPIMQQQQQQFPPPPPPPPPPMAMSFPPPPPFGHQVVTTQGLYPPVQLPPPPPPPQQHMLLPQQQMGAGMYQQPQQQLQQQQQQQQQHYNHQY